MTTLGSIYLFFRSEGFYPVECTDDDDARRQAEANPGTLRVEDTDGRPVWPHFNA